MAGKPGHGQAGCRLGQTRTEVGGRAAAIVMEPPGAQDLAPRVFAEGNQILEALPPEAAESPVTQRGRLRRVDRHAEDANTPRRDGRVEPGRVDAVAIVADASGGLRGREHLPALLPGPRGGGMPRPGAGPAPAPSPLQPAEDEAPPERRGPCPAAVAGTQRLGLGPDEGGPPLAGRALPSPAGLAGHGPAHGASGDAEAELHEECCGAPLLAPGRLVAGPRSHPGAAGAGPSRAPDAGPPAPEEADRLPVPADPGCRLDARKHFPPGDAPSQQDPREAPRGVPWRSRDHANCFRRQRVSAASAVRERSAVPKTITTSPPRPSTPRLSCPHPSIVRLGKNAPRLPCAGSAARQIHSRL
jgi:hypothetical protein